MIGIVGRVIVSVRDYQSDRVPVSANRASVLAIVNASDVVMQIGSGIDDRGYVSVIETRHHHES